MGDRCGRPLEGTIIMTYTYADLHTLIGQTMQALAPHYTSGGDALAKHDMTGVEWFGCVVALGLEPAPIAAQTLQALQAYGHLDRQRERLAGIAAKGFLTPTGEADTYRLTDQGRAAVQDFFAAAYDDFSAIIVEGVDLDRLVGLLQRVVDATAAASEPADKAWFQISRVTDDGSLGALARVDQYLTDLTRYRDDAHLAAWRTHDIKGIVWEAFSFIWEGQFADFPERLEQRGYPADKLPAITADLVDRGWITPDGDSFTVTEAGGKLRQAAEDETNRLFFIGWSALNDAEVQEVGALLTALRDRLAAMTATAEAESAP
jgi:hypothetical protein